jgi:excisionase family DNA binding protein
MISYLDWLTMPPQTRVMLEAMEHMTENAPQSPQDAKPDTLTVVQAAKHKGISDKQIRKLIESGRLKAENVGTGKRKHYRIALEALAAIEPPPAEPRLAPRQRRTSRPTASTRSIFPRVT